MAYKKYIVKNGKVYGPYIYHSRRVNGKVISEYRGTNKKLKYKKFGWISLGILGLIVLVFLAVNFVDFGGRITGQAVLDLNANYQENQPLLGQLTLSLSEGELIPVSSKIIFSNNGIDYEYDLIDFVASGISQQELIVYPDVYFTLNVLSSVESEEPEAPGTGGGGENETEVINETVTNETAINETATNETVANETATNETTTNETTETTNEAQEEILVEEPVLEEQSIEESAPEPEPETPSVLDIVSNFFLGLGATGNVVLEYEKEVRGSVFAGEEYIYDLEQNQTAEILSGSVRTDDKDLSDSDISLRIENNQAIVTTDYSEIKGQEEYFGVYQDELVIDLSELGLVFEQGNLDIKLVHKGEEIVSLSTVLEAGDIIVNESADISEDLVPEGDLNETEQRIIANITEEIENLDVLTDEEREILLNEFTNLSVEVTKSETINNRLIIRNELGDFWVEYSYDLNMSAEELEYQIETDRVKWLKDIVKVLSQEKIESQEVSEFLGNVSI